MSRTYQVSRHVAWSPAGLAQNGGDVLQSESRLRDESVGKAAVGAWPIMPPTNTILPRARMPLA
jgi:hypothetical protein